MNLDVMYKLCHICSFLTSRIIMVDSALTLGIKLLITCVLAMQYDLELIFVKNNHVFVDEYLKKPEFIELMRRLGALGDGNQDQSKFRIPYL